MKDIVGPANIDISNCVTPLIVTTQQPPSGAIGATYKDKATLSGGNNYDGTGSLTFTLYPNADCTGTPLDTETVSNITTDGDYTTPNGVQLNNAGTYYWVASFSGDGFNNQSSSGCADEPVVVAKNAPTIATLLSDLGPIAIGGSVHDSATLTGATADAGGSVKYAFYSSLSGCNAGTFATPGGTSLGTVTVTAGVVPDSDPTGAINAAGTYYFRAFYSGDPNNTGPVSSACADEALVVSPNTPTDRRRCCRIWVRSRSVARCMTRRR